jgi:hypothetical protein
MGGGWVVKRAFDLCFACTASLLTKQNAPPLTTAAAQKEMMAPK